MMGKEEAPSEALTGSDLGLEVSMWMVLASSLLVEGSRLAA